MIRPLLRKIRRKAVRRIKLLLRDKTVVLAATIFVIAAGTIIYSIYMQNRRFTIDPGTLKPLLSLIAKAESRGNYNAYFGRADNSSVKFTNMSIAEVLEWQTQFITTGKASSAVGRYQIINTTLSGLVNQLGLDADRQKFDAPTQDRLATALIIRRGANEYVNKVLSTDEFAANLAREWAGLPKITQPNPGDSYYASDGLNKSQVAVDEVRNAIVQIKAK